MTFINPQPQVFAATDFGCAQRLQADHDHELRYCQPWGCYMIYKDGRWIKENKKQSQMFATEVALDQQLATGATNLTRSDFIRKILYHSQTLMAIEPEEFDRVTGVLNMKNGVLNLEDGTLDPSNSSLYFTQQIPYEWKPGTPCPVWESHLDVMCKGNKELIDLIQILAGITLWGGQDRDQVFVHMRGEGRNGKGVFMRVFGAALGDYSLSAPLNLLTLAEGAHSTEYTTLKGKRFVSCSEMGTKKLNLGTLKVLTGGDDVTARAMRQNDVTFDNTWMIWIATNYSLNTTGDAGDALWERYVPIQLGGMIPEHERDIGIEKKLEMEVMNSGILNWAVEGCRKWRQQGLMLPDSVREWREEERENSDVFGTYFEERLFRDKNAKTLLSQITGDYAMWAATNGESLKMSSKAIGADLRTRWGATVVPGAKNQRYVHGVGIRH